MSPIDFILTEQTPLFNKPLILLLGTFDGVHLGHRSLIQKGIEEAHKERAELCILTFKTPPAWLFAPQWQKPLIMTLEERIKWLNHYGIGHILVMDFTEEIASLTALEFLSALKKRVSLFKLILGHDAKIGKDGNRDMIQQAADKLGIQLEFCPPYKVDGEIVSSTLIRQLIESEDFVKAKKLLGHNI